MTLQEALDLHQAGNLDAAELAYRAHLQTAPDDVDALHLLGVLRQQRGDAPAALDLIRQAIALAPDHVSTYGLTFEKGTSFWSRLSRGELARVEEEGERQMYEAAIDTLTAAGYEHYEVSNFAKSRHRCRHNENYWLGGQYFAVGPGAARFVSGVRETNHRSTTTYITRILGGQSPVAETERLAREDAARERLVFALRRLEGVDVREFAMATGFSVEQLGSDALARVINLGLLER